MKAPVVVIGSGVGGLAAALRLRSLGHEVVVCEAGESLGGLAAGLVAGGMTFDGGPYILLDRPGLEWACRRLEVPVEGPLTMRRILEPYQVSFGEEAPVRIHHDRDLTASELDTRWPGAGLRYRRFVTEMEKIYVRTSPLLYIPRPRPWQAWSSLPFLMRSLGSVLTRARLPSAVARALSIWTQVAGQDLSEAPAPMALVPALMHQVGAWYPSGGIRAIPEVLATLGHTRGIEFKTRARVKAVRCEGGRVTGVELADGTRIRALAVLSNSHGVGTYLDLVGGIQAKARTRLEKLPLQSPGVGAYLRVRRSAEPPYLRFHVPSERESCRLFVATAEVDPACERDGWSPARLVAPMSHHIAEREGESGQREYLARLLEEPWWKRGLAEYEVVATRVPAEWGRCHHLYRDSMNPVMTARFMRAGRIAHRSPYVRGLYFAGSSTHPGQWVSFCAISGIHAAEALHEDHR